MLPWSLRARLTRCARSCAPALPASSPHPVLCRSLFTCAYAEDETAAASRPLKLARELGVPLQRVMRYCREQRFADKKPSELVLDYEHARRLAIECGYAPERIALREEDVVRRDYWDSDENDSTQPRRPLIVSVMGHVNHGKTTLMDALRRANVAASEPGGITQSLTAFQVKLREDEGGTASADPAQRWRSTMTLLDTPGHAAFFLMRENGASVSDALIVIIAADEGFGPQTEEVMSIATDSNMPVIVAINKIDIAKPEQIERVYAELHKRRLLDRSVTRATNPIHHGRVEDFEPAEDFAVKAVVEVSALHGTNLSLLKRTLFTFADHIEPFLHPNAETERAECTVIESHQQAGLGRMLRVVVHWGRLLPEQWFVTDRYLGRIRSLHDDDGHPLSAAYPGQPVSIAGFKSDTLPPSGSGLFTLPKEEAERVQELRELMLEYKFKEMHGILYLPDDTLSEPVEALEEASEAEPHEDDSAPTEAPQSSEVHLHEVSLGKGIKMVYSPRHKKWRRVVDEESENAPSLPVVVKADNIGRLETVLALLESLAAETTRGRVVVNVVASGVGAVTATDLFHAQVEVEENGHACVPVYCFGRVALDPRAQEWYATQPPDLRERLPVLEFAVVYDLIEHARNELARVAKSAGLPKELTAEDRKRIKKNQRRNKPKKGKSK